MQNRVERAPSVKAGRCRSSTSRPCDYREDPSCRALGTGGVALPHAEVVLPVAGRRWRPVRHRFRRTGQRRWRDPNDRLPPLAGPIRA